MKNDHSKQTEPSDESQSISKIIATELELPASQVHAAVRLLIAGNTVPFIARYRKEATQGLDEIALRAIEDALERENALTARKATVLKAITDAFPEHFNAGMAALIVLIRPITLILKSFSKSSVIKLLKGFKLIVPGQ